MRLLRGLLAVLLVFTIALTVNGNDVLVIGGAGFIGYHITLELLNRGHSPIVLHNFDDEKHSSQWEQMKRRMEGLHKKGVPLYHGDLCRMPLLEYFINSKSLSGIIYFGENFGENILKYIERRLQCFVALLELLRLYKEVPLIYSTTPEASQIKFNFDAKDVKPAPVPLVSVLKSAEQQFSEVYCNMYQIKTVGVRPFYPYGPMADSGSMIYNIAEAISKGKSVQLPHNAQGTPLTYDFTSVTDIATGICNALKHMTKSCGVVYDLGSGHPQKVTTATDILKKQLKKSYMYRNEIQVLNFTSSMADITLARKEIGYTPTADFEEGVKPFVEWFLSKKKRVQRNIMKFVNVSLDPDMKMQQITKKGDMFYNRVKNLRLKYEAQATGPIAKFYPDKNFTFFPGVSSGFRNKKLKGRTIEEMKKKCQRIDECIGFTPEGSILAKIDLQNKWRKGSGLYVADIDVCQAGHHNCRGNYTCKYQGPSQFTCGCAKGWKSTKGNVCVQVDYFEGVTSDKEREWQYDDRLNGHQFNGQVTDTFTEHKETNINGTVILSYPDAQGDIEKLKSACLHTYRCVGFNVKDNTLISEVKGLTKKSSEFIAYTRNLKD